MKDVPLNPVYRRVFDELMYSRYATFNVYDFYVKRKEVGRSDRVNVVVRVDVDSGLHLAPLLARELEDRGISASHYFLAHERYYELWNSGIPKFVAQQTGQEVGLHTDHYFDELTEGVDAISAIKQDIARLSEEAGTAVKGMVYHGHTSINALGVTNRDIYNHIEPPELGLEYHDGDMEPYTDRSSKSGWRPNCDVRCTDYSGFPNSYGWTYLPRKPLRVLRSTRAGQVVHLTFHTRNAFQYWVNWSEEYGEASCERESTLVFWKKRFGCMLLAIRPSIVDLVRLILLASIHCVSWFLAKIFGPFAKGWREPDPCIDKDKYNDCLWNHGLSFWEQRLNEIGVDWKNKDILEVGSGVGQWLAVMSSDAASSCGVEPQTDLIKHTRDRYNELNVDGVALIEGCAEALPVSSRSKDIVICFGVLQFTKQVRALHEISRVLRPGGRAYVHVNGFGYCLYRMKMGIGNRDPNRTRQGLRSLVAGLARWKEKYLIEGAKPVTVRRMREMAQLAGLTIVDIRLWLPIKKYNLEYAGFATNYLFELRKSLAEDDMPGVEGNREVFEYELL